MLALYDDQRRNFIRLGIMLAIGGAAVLPFTVSPTSLAAAADTLQASPVIGVPAVPERMEFPRIFVSRDPFAPDQTAFLRDAAANGIDGRTDLDAAASLPIVRALVTGNEARALIENAGAVQVLGVGDRMGNETVKAIDATGVTLSNGLRLILATPQ